ncbi:hypothetical protein LEMLEM_LOCUS13474, partial [Lemmus lemmus]
SPSVRKSGSLNSVLSRNVGATQQPRASLQATLSQSQVGSCRLLPGWLTSAAGALSSASSTRSQKEERFLEGKKIFSRKGVFVLGDPPWWNLYQSQTMYSLSINCFYFQRREPTFQMVKYDVQAEKSNQDKSSALRYTIADQGKDSGGVMVTVF